MRIIKTVLFFMIVSLSAVADNGVKSKERNSFKVLCYHNVVDKIVDTKIMSITTDQLIAQFKWLKANNYNIITIDDILKAERGESDLPEKSILLTFDDGYESFYTRIYPLLRLYNFPAVFALVGKWMQTPQGEDILYGNLPRPRKLLLSWNEVREMLDSGLVELASHSYDSHHGILANPQGNLQPALTTLSYDPQLKKYETVKEYIKRVDNDIKRSSDVISENTGYRPRSIAWPYGAYNGIVQSIAEKYGMNISLTLDDGINTPSDLAALKRILLGNASDFKSFYWSIQEHDGVYGRSVFIDIDDIYDKDPLKTNENLGKVIEKIAKLKILTVVLKAYSDEDGDGFADSLYFPNNILPMKADLLNRVAWQLKSRAKIDDVYVRMPLFSFEAGEKRFSPGLGADMKKIEDIYFFMAKQSHFKGVLFEDKSGVNFTDSERAISFSDRLIKKMRFFTKEIDKSVLLSDKTVISLKRENIRKLMRYFDYLYIDAKPSKKSLAELLKKLKSHKDSLSKCNFVLDKDNGSWDNLSKAVKFLLVNRAMNIGYRQSNFTDTFNEKDTAAFIGLLSLKRSPFE